MSDAAKVKLGCVTSVSRSTAKIPTAALQTKNYIDDFIEKPDTNNEQHKNE